MALTTSAERDPADGHIPGLQLDDEDAFGEPGHPVLDAFDSRREGDEVEHRQRQRHRSGHDQPGTNDSRARNSTEEITGDWEPNHCGKSEPEAEEVEEEVLQGEDAIHNGAEPGHGEQDGANPPTGRTKLGDRPENAKCADHDQESAHDEDGVHERTRWPEAEPAQRLSYCRVRRDPVAPHRVAGADEAQHAPTEREQDLTRYAAARRPRSTY